MFSDDIWSIFGPMEERRKERGEKLGFGQRRVTEESFPKGRSGVVGGDPELRQTRADRYSSGEL